MTRISLPAINRGRIFIAGRIVNAFGFSHSLLRHFHNRGVKSVSPCAAEGPADSPKGPKARSSRESVKTYPPKSQMASFPR